MVIINDMLTWKLDEGDVHMWRHPTYIQSASFSDPSHFLHSLPPSHTHPSLPFLLTWCLRWRVWTEERSRPQSSVERAWSFSLIQEWVSSHIWWSWRRLCVGVWGGGGGYIWGNIYHFVMTFKFSAYTQMRWRTDRILFFVPTDSIYSEVVQVSKATCTLRCIDMCVIHTYTHTHTHKLPCVHTSVLVSATVP